jgi:hypothetical protein
MKIMNWVGVEEQAPFEKLPAGGYVVRITDVEDVAEREYLNVVYDVAEGDYAGFYSDDFSLNNPWKHRFVRSYKDSCESMFKAFLARLEESNRGFSVAKWQVHCDVRELVGLELGVVVQSELYTTDKGDDRERLNVCGVYASQDIRNGDFRVPEVKDSRKAAGAVRVGSAVPVLGAAPYAPTAYAAGPAAAAPSAVTVPAAAYGAAPIAPAAPVAVPYDDVPFR